MIFAKNSKSDGTTELFKENILVEMHKKTNVIFAFLRLDVQV